MATLSFRELEMNQRPAQPQGQHIARMADITLNHADDFTLDMDDPGLNFDFGPLDGITSQDFGGDGDLGLDFGDKPEAESAEIGRDADISRRSVESRPLERNQDGTSNRATSEAFGQENTFDLGAGIAMGGMDFDMGLNFDGDVPMAGMDGAPKPQSPSRACKTPA
jgi:cohesin complex subunit SCC1